MEKYDFSAEDANSINSLVYIISAIASPLFGFVIDKTGRNVSWMLLSILVTIGAHSFLAFTYANPYICMVSYSFSSYHSVKFTHTQKHTYHFRSRWDLPIQC